MSKSTVALHCPSSNVMAEVRYSLAEMLREVQIERTSGVFALEKIDQPDISELFKSKVVRRGKPRR